MNTNRTRSHEKFRLTIFLVGLVAVLSLVVVTWAISLPLDSWPEQHRESVPGQNMEQLQELGKVNDTSSE